MPPRGYSTAGRGWWIGGAMDLGYGRLRRPNPRLCEYQSAPRLPWPWLCKRGAKRTAKWGRKGEAQGASIFTQPGVGTPQEALPQDNRKKRKTNRGQRLNIRARCGLENTPCASAWGCIRCGLAEVFCHFGEPPEALFAWVFRVAGQREKMIRRGRFQTTQFRLFR